MPSMFQRMAANKWVFTAMLTVCCYVLLRGIAFFQHQPFDLPGSHFTFNGKQVRYVCAGDGKPFVVFETGFGSDSAVTWSAIVKALPENFTACYYDRLGHGGSDDVPRKPLPLMKNPNFKRL